jgi:hypothetical protein
MSESKNTCILFDFENVEVNLREKYKLSLKEAGYKKIIEHVSTKGNLVKKYIFVGAYWNNFSSQKNFAVKLGFPVDVICKTKSAADGALIVETMKLFINKDSDSIDQFILIASDGGYGNLVQFLYQEDKDVFIISNKKAVNSDLLDLLTESEWIEDILSIADDKTYDSELVQQIETTPEIRATVVKVRNLKHLPHIHKSYLEKQLFIASSKHTSLNAYDTLDKCKILVKHCCSLGIFTEYNAGTSDGKNVPALKLDESHILVMGIK